MKTVYTATKRWDHVTIGFPLQQPYPFRRSGCLGKAEFLRIMAPNGGKLRQYTKKSSWKGPLMSQTTLTEKQQAELSEILKLAQEIEDQLKQQSSNTKTSQIWTQSTSVTPITPIPRQAS